MTKQLHHGPAPGKQPTAQGPARPLPGRSVVLGTAGHIDHGKTALVLALTGTDTDRLPEEKARGITIDLGFAAIDLLGPKGELIQASLIDVPGHHAFIRNMLAGTGGIRAVLFVVAADEGVRAQTREHLQICRLLGVQRGVVALTKSDAVSQERLVEATHEVQAFVQGSFLENAPVIAVSALNGRGIEVLRTALGHMAASLPESGQDQVARLPVDRVFSVRGFGTVVTGTLLASSVQSGQTVVLQPAGRLVRVRGVQVHGQTVAQSHAPSRTALNLAGVEVADIHRGDTVVPENTLRPSKAIDAELELLPGAVALRHRARVRLHAFASETPATVLFYETDLALTPGSRPLVRLRLEQPLILAPGDRFVLRALSPAATLGGGRVLDAHPIPRQRKKTTLAWLDRMRNASIEQQIDLRVSRYGARGTDLSTLVYQTGRTQAAVQRSVDTLVSRGALLQDGAAPIVVERESLEQAENRLLRALAANPASPTATRTEMRSQTGLDERSLGWALRRLVAAKRVVVQGDTVQLPASPGSSKPVSQRVHDVEVAYQRAGLASPLVSELAQKLGVNAGEMREVVTTLLRAGRLVRLGSDALLVHADALAALREQLQPLRGRPLDVAAFKAFTGLTRKHAIPLLEHLDGARITRKAGDVRIVL